MSSAEEILKEHYTKLVESHPKAFLPWDKLLLEKEPETADMIRTQIEAMKEYASQACEEQRENCWQGFQNCPQEYMGEKIGILNALAPELL